MPLIDLDDQSWAAHADPEWADRPSLHEMQLRDSVELAYEVASQQVRQTEKIHEIVTRAIAATVPINEVKNEELGRILFAIPAEEDVRRVRLFRNSERRLKLDSAGVHIQQLLCAKKIPPSDGGRLWYAVLLHATGIQVVADHFRLCGHTDQPTFQQSLIALTETACYRFGLNLEASLKKSKKLPLVGYPLNEVRQFMDYCALVNWQESKVKRNPCVSIKRLLDLAPVFDKYSFDE